MVIEKKNAPSRIPFPLFERFVRLGESVPRVEIGRWPTPVTLAKKFADTHGLASLHIKRDDESHPTHGGNKIRGLEFLLGEARSRDAKSLLTFSSAGSHHVCRTAFHARKFNIPTFAVVVDQPPADYAKANIAAAIAAGATYVPASRWMLIPRLLKQWMSLSSGETAPCFHIPPGGTSPRACIGHVNAALELRQQVDAGLLPAPDFLYVALGSLGTAAGLALGCRIAGLPTRVVGVVVSYRWYCTRGRWTRLANRTLAVMRSQDPTVPGIPLRRNEVTVIRSALGKGYARPTPRGTSLANEFRRLEGIEADNTYTGKTLDGMMQFIEQRRLHDKHHLFWHTFDSIPEVRIPTANIPRPLQKYFDARTP